MKKIQKSQRRLRGYAIVLALLLSTSITMSYFFQHNFNPSVITASVQEIVHQKDEKVSAELTFLKNIYLENPDSIYDILHRYKYAYEKKGYLFRIQSDGLTLFWSDNKIPLDQPASKLNQQIINLGNGWYRKIEIKTGKTIFEGYYLIKRDYNYQNDYLENAYHSTYGLSISVGFLIDTASSYQVFDKNDSYLFSLTFEGKNAITNFELTILFVLYLLCFLFLIGIVYELHLAIYLKTKKYLLFLIAFALDIIIIRALIFILKIPEILYQSDLFSPLYFAYSDLIPSIFDLVLNALTLTIISFFLFYHLKFNIKNLHKGRTHRYFIIISLFLHVFIFFKGIDFILHSLVIDSSISLDLNNLFGLSLMSVISIIIISLTILSYVLITSKLAFFAYKYSRSVNQYYILAIISFTAYLGICNIIGSCNIISQAFVLIFILTTGYFFHLKRYQFTLGSIIFYILLFSVFSTYALHIHNDVKEKEHRKLLAVQLATEQRDPLAEYLFNKEFSDIKSDNQVLSIIDKYGQNTFEYDDVSTYIISNYFKGYWEKYNCQITICSPDENLFLETEGIEVHCYSFFENKILNDGLETENQNLYFLNYGPGENGYIGIIKFPLKKNNDIELTLYIELFPKAGGRDMGFPDLLINEDVGKMPDISSYSYVKYKDGMLYKRVGDYVYKSDIHNPPLENDQYLFYTENEYNHLFYKINENRSLIISLRNKNLLDILAPFSYIFLSYIIVFGFIFFVFIFPFSRKTTTLSFRTRMQISISSVILFSFLVIGIFTLIYINNLNEKKNRDILSEKTLSVLVEMQHKFSGTDYFDESNKMILSSLLKKFSHVFFTDINLFNLDGRLVSSSRPEIYDEQLISRYIHPQAFKALSIENSTFFIHNENIGKQEYLSAYIPFANGMGDIIAYLNLPYFSKENDLNKEISTFLVAYINIYVILIAISILIAILISNYISRPIKMIMMKIRQVKLGGQNETIDWKRKDEIGQLVIEYNRMIDELTKSAELLARSERESAWREMAKQIAHEIKNPLTPMKLSVQYLQRAWQNKSADWDKRLDKFTQTMIEQIDSLSIIASEFSDFAKMPVAKKELTDLIQIIKSSIALNKNYDHISFDFHYAEGRDYNVNVDREQLMRALNNLLKNSIQAIGKKPDGHIEILLSQNSSENIIEIVDNGGGISEDISEKIFSPNFTTKSGGMGLGLAIVKNVIDNSGGKISYESKKGRGTTFVIMLPAA